MHPPTGTLDVISYRRRHEQEKRRAYEQLPGSLALFAVLGPMHPRTINPFYHPFYPDVTHVRKDTRPSPALPYCKRRKARQGLETTLSSFHNDDHFMTGQSARNVLLQLVVLFFAGPFFLHTNCTQIVSSYISSISQNYPSSFLSGDHFRRGWE